jgi:hypothetical protein
MKTQADGILARHLGMFDPDADLPSPQHSLTYLGAYIIAGLRLARERQVNVRVVPTSHAIYESADLAHEIYERRIPEGVPTDNSELGKLWRCRKIDDEGSR